MRPDSGAVRAARLILPAVLGWTGPAVCAQAPASPAPSPPALDRDFPDPDVIRVGGGYYAYATGRESVRGPVRRLSVSYSRDLARWSAPRDPLAGPAAWARPGTSYWAPHVVPRDGRYLLYYAAPAGPAGADRYRIGLAISASPAGPFRDVGPIEPDDAAVNIDPMLFEDAASGRAFLYWGRNGVVAAREMRRNGRGFAPASRPVDVLAPLPGRPFESVVEAPFVVAANGFYYLFYSGDDCCSHPRYAVMVARSRSPLGPFERLGDQPGRDGDSRILAASERWLAPGHCAVFRDAGGRWRIAYAAIDARRPSQGRSGAPRRPMRIDALAFRDGWPVVRPR